MEVKIADPDHCSDDCPFIDPGLCDKYKVGPAKEPQYLRFDIERFGKPNCWCRCADCIKENS